MKVKGVIRRKLQVRLIKGQVPREHSEISSNVRYSS